MHVKIKVCVFVGIKGKLMPGHWAHPRSWSVLLLCLHRGDVCLGVCCRSVMADAVEKAGFCSVHDMYV